MNSSEDDGAKKLKQTCLYLEVLCILFPGWFQFIVFVVDDCWPDFCMLHVELTLLEVNEVVVTLT
jgi:hypothetical protein